MVELSVNEFAYLLATVGAKGIIGLEDPQLFPEGTEAEDKVFGAGRAELEANGWIEEVADHPGEHRLDPFLLEMVAMVGAPEYVVAGAEGADSDRHIRMIYVVGQRATELAPMKDGNYALGYIPEDSSVSAQISEMFHLNGSSRETEFSISPQALEELKSKAAAGEMEQAAGLLEGDSADQNAVSRAAAGPRLGRVVVLRAAEGQIATGRRAFLFGTQDNVWLEYQPNPQDPKLTLVQASAARLEDLVKSWLEELARNPRE